MDFENLTNKELIAWLRSLSDYALSDADINKILYLGKTSFYKYRDINPSVDLRSYLDGEGRMMLLLPVQSDTSGHWVCLWLNRRRKTIHYWDPYGLQPDHFIEHWRTPATRDLTPKIGPMLDELGKQGFSIEVNTYQYQHYSDKHATCGRWCAVRLMLKSVEEDKFKSLIQSIKLPKDLAIVGLTTYILKK